MKRVLFAKLAPLLEFEAVFQDLFILARKMVHLLADRTLEFDHGIL